MRYSFGWLPFSVGDLGYTLAGILVLRFVIQKIRRRKYAQLFWGTLATLAMVYAVFHILWGFNYYRTPIQAQFGDQASIPKEQLLQYSQQLVADLNQKHAQVQPNAKEGVKLPYSRQEILELFRGQYQFTLPNGKQQQLYPMSNKTSVYSLMLTYMGYSGYLNPFTGEAQSNRIMPKYKLAFTAAHEQAHQLGYAAENEANFIGYLAAIQHPNAYIQYSAQMAAANYILSSVYQTDSIVYKQQIHRLRPGIRKDFEKSRAFWQAHQNPIEPLFKSSYDAFLKANAQAQGIRSYNGFVNLLVQYHYSTFKK